MTDDSGDTYSVTSSKSRSLSKTPSARSFTTKRTVQDTIQDTIQDTVRQGSAKVTESQFPGHLRVLAIASKTQVRFNMIYKNIHDATGPNRLEFAWDAIKDAAKKAKNREIDAAFQKATGDVNLKKKLITFVRFVAHIFLSLIMSFHRLCMLEQVFWALLYLKFVAWSKEATAL